MNASHVTSADSRLRQSVADAEAMLRRLPGVFGELSTIADLCARVLNDGGKLLLCGNGGSAAECQHFAAEFVVRLSPHSERGALPAIALTTDTSLLTACANDFGFDRVFARQVEALLQRGDSLLLFSTSGQSPNLIEAARTARERGGHVIAFVGEKETPLDALSHHVLHVPSASPQRVQEGHLLCGHLFVELVEEAVSRNASGGKP